MDMAGPLEIDVEPDAIVRAEWLYLTCRLG